MKFLVDTHVHTVSSGHAYSTLEEYVKEAKRIRLQSFAMTDHGPAMPGGPHYYHFSNMRMIPREIEGIKIYRGIEANIINDQGQLDIKDEEIRWGELDVIMVAMHPRCGYDDHGEEKNTEVLLKTLKNPYVNVIAHVGNPKYPVNLKAVVRAAMEHNVLLEVNNSSDFSRPGSHTRCIEVAREAKRIGWKVVVGTDSHISTMLGRFDSALALLKEAGLEPKDVVNTDQKMIQKYLLRQ